MNYSKTSKRERVSYSKSSTREREGVIQNPARERERPREERRLLKTTREGERREREKEREREKGERGRKEGKGVERERMSSSLAFDEFGRPFIIVREQGQKERVKGLAAQKANIAAARAVVRTLRTSLGPKGMDKMLQSGDGDITISTCLFSLSSSCEL